MPKILLIEDSLEFHLLVIKTLGALAEVVVAVSCQKALDCLERESFDLILLDVGLPDKDGFTFCQELQNDSKLASIPVIFITGKSEPADILAGFSLGAEDFITKPFGPLVFRARIEARLKKIKKAENKEEVIEIDGLQVNLPQMKAYLLSSGIKRDLQLTLTEFKLLRQLIRFPERVFSREQLLNLVWGDSVVVSDRSVDVHVSSLRKKLGEQGKTLQTVQNMGYRFQSLPKDKKVA